MSTQAGETLPVRVVVGVLSCVVFVAVGVVMALRPDAGSAGPVPSTVASFNAALNASSAACLVTGYVLIRRGLVRAHRACMVTAFGLSSAFLVGYLVHHASVGSVPFRGEGALRTLYFAILVPHVLLAAVVVPLALLTIYRGWTSRVDAHRRVARWTLPIWLYVSLSGVAVYWMLYHGPGAS